MVFSSYKQQRIIYFHGKGFKALTMSRLLRREGIPASRRGIDKFLRKYEDTGTIGRRAGSGRPSKITPEIKALVDRQKRMDDENTAVQLLSLLKKEVKSMIKRLGTKYCLLEYVKLLRIY